MTLEIEKSISNDKKGVEALLDMIDEQIILKIKEIVRNLSKLENIITK